MLRTCVAAFALACCWFHASIPAQTPEITVAARSAQELGAVLKSFGLRGEMFGLNGPAAFLDSYGRGLDEQQPLTAALTFTTKSPMFAAEFVVKDATAFFSMLEQDGVVLNKDTGELTKTGSSLRFFVRQNGNRVRIADNADFLKNVRWPASEQFASNVAVITRIDWRNLQPEMRGAVAQQTLSIFLPQTNPMASVSLDALPEVLSNIAADRVAALFRKAENITLQFSIQQQGQVQVFADVLNRTVAGRQAVPSPFASISSDKSIAAFEWNTPIESELRTSIQAWAAQLAMATKQLFAGDEIGDDSGLKVLHEGAAILARHCTETVALPNLQGSFCTLADGDRPIIVAGLRVANPARLDSELQKLVKLAIENGAPFQFTPNVGGDDDLSLHRLQLPVVPELATARDLFGETLTIHLATSSHAVLLGVGNGSDKFLKELVSAQSGSSQRWLDAVVANSQNPLIAKLGLRACQLRIVPASQGFHLFATVPDNKVPTQLTSTRADNQ